MSNRDGLPPEIAEALPSLHDHVRELVESSAFRGSRRGQEFLQYIVNKALAGQFDDLKERALGVALFGRSPTYDTGQDAIVRVTASDVRKRLHQYYSEKESAIRIDLPSGSYHPEFRVQPIRESHPAPAPPSPPQRRPRKLALAATLLGVLAIAIAAAWWYRGYRANASLPLRNILPWSGIFGDGRQVQLILADPDVPAMEALTGSTISLSDYANREFIKQPGSYSADMQRAFTLLRGVNVAAVDVGIVLDVARLAATDSARLKTHTARSLQLGSFKTDDNFILLGSPRSNPWGELFGDQLDFEFVPDPSAKREFLRNKRVQPGEQATYVPTAAGWGTGHALATVALVANPGQSGKVLLLAGTNAEGTEAAGRFVTNPAQLVQALQSRGIDPAGPPCYFQILLQVRTMAGSPSTFEVIACHRLSAVPR
ncbi:MAG: hypothetical protein JNL98_26350 [Bryobacterales bacterium]|nr:hypothetical protein [Bryobacterales bacterium]